jgi:LmbE family N-acetylglucosaminyl deacetylase
VTKLQDERPVLTPTTTELTWINSLVDVPAWQPGNMRTVVVSPHPDDETLGAGGLIATQRSSQIPVTLLSVTDGEAAYPDRPALGATRRLEQILAADALGLPRETLLHLALPDSAVTQAESALADRIEACVDSDTLLVAPWPLDPHPDHEACGRAAAKAARHTGARFICYFFWTWHRCRPECLSGLPLGRLVLSADARARRARALGCHFSQLYRDEGPPILPEVLLAPARRPFETFVIYGDQHNI